MTRKKSRPTHRENASSVPSNERGFYKMFWNSMDTNPGTNGPNSSSQVDVHLTSPPVIIGYDSSAVRPCVYDGNSCDKPPPPVTQSGPALQSEEDPRVAEEDREPHYEDIQVYGVAGAGTPAYNQVASISEASRVLGISTEANDNPDDLASEIPLAMPEKTPEMSTPMDVGAEPHSPTVQVHIEENTLHPPENGNSYPSTFENFADSTMNELSGPPSPALSDTTLKMLQSIMNNPDENFEGLALPDLPSQIDHHPDSSEQNQLPNEVEHESAEESSIATNQGVMTQHESIACGDENAEVSGKNEEDVMADQEEDEFPAYVNFIPKKIKVDSIGILRSANLLKESVCALYKEYLKDDFLLRTTNSPKPPAEESCDDVQETPTFPSVKVNPINCCVKMERLPDPLAEKSTVTMSDETFKTWKRQIIQQRNEEKFRHLNVWRRGRTRLWRECQLAGMDRATYDEQVAYVKKHKLDEHSSSDGDSSGEDNTNDVWSHRSDSSDESSQDEGHEHNEPSPMHSGETSPDINKRGVTQSARLPPAESKTSAAISSPDEYTVVERASNDESSTTQAPSALKITIRKTSISKDKDDDNKEKPTDSGEDFAVPAKTSQTKRRVAMKRTFRPSGRVPKVSAPPKSNPADNKTTKSASVESEDLYDQSLLGRRSYEVENFNLLEKWEIPFEQPTLFRSPRAASRLAQLKTKEAFAPVLKRHAPPKTPTSAATVATTTVVTTAAVSKDVKEVVEWLCSKTVEAMLFSGFDPAGSEKRTDDVKSVDGTGSSTHKEPIEETLPILNESSEMSQSETSSTLNASSDFGGSLASLTSEDFVPPKDKASRKPRRRKRGSAWNKTKKKVKGKVQVTEEQPAVEETSYTNRLGATGTTSLHSMEQPPAENTALDEVIDSPAHSTQVPVVSEGPGQGPRGTEDDSALLTKHPTGANQTVHEMTETKQTVVGANESAKFQRNQGVIPPRLTRSKQPTVNLDPELLESFGVRKRKCKALNVVSQDEETKKLKPQVTEEKQQNDKPQSGVTSNLTDGGGSTTGEVIDDSNTQVPEVSEGPGEVGLDHDDKQGHGNQKETPARMLRSRSRGAHSAKSTFKVSCDQKTEEPEVQVGETKPAEEIVSEEPLPESPQSPPPEPETSFSGRITRSKKRSGPVYVTVKSSDGRLPSVCDIVDSIARQRLPLSELFDDSAANVKPPTDPIPVNRVQVQTDNDSTSVQNVSSNDQQPKALNEIPWGKSDRLTSPMDSNSSTEPLAKSADGVEEDTRRSADSSSGNLPVNSSVTNDAGIGKLEVLDTLTNILAVNSPGKEGLAEGAAVTLSPPSSSRESLPIPPSISSSTQSSMNTTTPTVSSTSLPTSLAGTQDITSILPGTFLNSLLNSTLDANLTTYNNVINDSTALTDDPDGDLVIDEGEAPESDTRIDVNFWENLTNADLSDTNADFSDDDNNTDLADKINKIIKDQIHQDPVPVPSLKQKETCADSNSDNKQAAGEPSPLVGEIDKNAPALSRRDSIDERTGLPNNLIQRLRDPRIRSRLLSHLEEVETNDKTPPPPVLNSVLGSSVTSSSGDPQTPAITNSDPRKKASTADGLCPSSQTVSSVVTNPVVGVQLTTISSGQTTPSISPLELPGAQIPVSAQETPFVQPAVNLDQPEVPPDPSKVDFLVPPSDDEDEDESIKRRPSKKSRKQVDVELMYKSPLEDLQSEARPAYGERAPRRFADSYQKKRIGEDRQTKWDDRRSGVDGPRERRFEDRGRSRSRDRRFQDRGRSKSRERGFEDRGRSRSRSRFDDRGRDRSRSRDGRAYCDRPRRDQSRDRRAYDPYPGRGENEIPPQHLDHTPAPYNQPPWSTGDPGFIHHPTMMRPPMESPRWQQNYQEPHAPPHPPIFMPEPPKIDFMETRLINLELLPKTTNLEVSPLRKVYSYFDKDSLQLFEIPKPQYDPNDQPCTIKMMDPVSEEMVDFIQTPRPTSGLTKKYFAHVPPNLSLDDVVKFHCISPAYVMVRDNEEDESSSSDEEKDEADAVQKKQLGNSALEQKKRLNKPVVEEQEKQERESQRHLQTQNESFFGSLRQESSGLEFVSDPLQNLLRNLPLLKEQYSLQASQPPLIPPPPPTWNDVDLRISRTLTAGVEDFNPYPRSPSPPKERSSRSVSPRKKKTSKSPRRRRRSRSRSPSPRSDMSISPTRSESRSPSVSRRNTRNRSRSRSTERTRSKRSLSPKRHSSSISPSRKHSRR